MSVSINFHSVTKKYGDITVIPDLSLKIKQGEFFTLLGPSGCGKTTLLRMVAGFVSIERGKISFDDKFINNIEPKNRNIGMVFQDYALFPHLTVKENIAFGLKNRNIARRKINEMVEEVLKVVQIEEHSDKLPENLSGGQQQRVALARAIVIKPDVLLMDEPLSNLDAKLRIDMRNVIKELQNKLGITTIYVTHDQEEAMAVSDKIAVIKSGIIQQIGSPREIYQRPENLFVASFIGQTNIVNGSLKCQQGDIVLQFSNIYKEVMNNISIKYEEGKKIPVKVSLRPEEIIVSSDSEGIEAVIEENIFLGPNTNYFVKTESGKRIKIVQESIFQDTLTPGTRVRLKVKKEKINIYTGEPEININKENKRREVLDDAR